MLRDRLRSNRRICRIDVSAFASVLTALLFLLLVYRVFSQSQHGGHFSNLPRSVNSRELAKANREDALVVAAFHDGRIFFDTKQVSPEELPAKLREKIQAGAPPIVFIHADPRARYRSVSVVLDAIHDAGLSDVAFLTESAAGSNHIQGQLALFTALSGKSCPAITDKPLCCYREMREEDCPADRGC